MTPICFLAVFADDVIETERNVDIIGLNNIVSIPGMPKRARGDLTRHEMSLFVAFLADAGDHTISVALRGGPSLYNVSFKTVTANNIRRIDGEFPIVIDYVVNEYPILLDGSPFATAYLVSQPEFEDD